MSSKPTLIIMAAGLGSRFGGNKQITSMTDSGEIIMDFSLYDAHKAGVEDVVIIIKKDIEEELREHLEKGAARHMNIHFVYQDKEDTLGIDLHKLITKIAMGNKDLEAEIEESVEKREKPWGTGHAVLAARDLIDGPFMVINADDYYGSTAFLHMYDFLMEERTDTDKPHFAMAGYKLSQTLSESGHVSRGVCTVTEDSMLSSISERTMIARQPSGEIAFSEDEGKSWTALPEDAIVSMNFWGFTKDMMDALRSEFPAALEGILTNNPKKGEFYLPIAVGDLLDAGKIDVKVLVSSDKWYGVTNAEDKDLVHGALQSMIDKGDYHDPFWA